MVVSNKEFTLSEREKVLDVLKIRFEENMNRHSGISWEKVQSKLEAHPEKLFSLSEMERTGGEPDVVGQDGKSGEYIFVDCSVEIPADRRSLCYDDAALASRKENKPKGSALNMAISMGIDLLPEEEYRLLQTLGEFDLKTSSWIATP